MGDRLASRRRHCHGTDELKEKYTLLNREPDGETGGEKEGRREERDKGGVGGGDRNEV